MALVTQPEDKSLVVAHTSKAGPRMVSVVGMGGLGKTTLTKKVYDTKDLRDKFDSHAWITVSQTFDRKELLKGMVEQLFGVDSFKRFLEEHQGKVLEVHHLTLPTCKKDSEKRYFIVLDDVWTTEAWNFFKLSFPDNSKDDSCVVVTTRDGKLAEQFCSASYIHQLKFLEKEVAKSLFLKKAQKRPDDLDKDDHTKGTVEKILNKCGGLPLAIVTIGANKVTKEWENLYNQHPSELSSNPSLEDLRRVVHLSYNHLPSHFKPCFLHLSIFPEDFEIEGKHLVNRWVAEGFVTHATSRRTLEDIAESYFYELISRSMIQPSKLDFLGHVKTCRVHDISVSISTQENHIFLVEERTSATATSTESIRHISCLVSGKLNSSMDFSRVRSFTMFSEPMQPIASLCSSEFKMLRVLDLKNARFYAVQQHIRNIGLLLHLKYLHFPNRVSDVYAIPRCIGNLQGLQTLDLQKSRVSSLPAEITKLHNLRSLRCSKSPRFAYFSTSDYGEWFSDAFSLVNLADRYSRGAATTELHMALSSCWSYSSGIKLPRGVGRLKQLQILEKVDTKRTTRKAIKELGELTQLRRLVVRGRAASKEKCKAFCEAAQKLSSLRSLNVSTKESAYVADEELDMLVSFESPLPSLERLKLKGRPQKIPAWVGNCVNLVKVDLEYCKLKELEALAQLPNLIQLRLDTFAYDAEKLVLR
jgi:disease resistance protein RPM1